MMRRRLPRDFFVGDPVDCARALLGCEIRWNGRVGRIVETEAYAAHGDEACHTFFRKSARAFVEKHAAGAAYVYLNYGMYWLLNALVKGGTCDGFVLVRAIEPLWQTGVDRVVANGPGKLTRAMGIDGAVHGLDLCCEERGGWFDGSAAVNVGTSRRIGISKATELPWRFFEMDNPHVSGRRGVGK